MVVPGSVPATVGRRLVAYVIDVVATLVFGGGLLIGGLAGQWRTDGTLARPAPVTLIGAGVLVVFLLVQVVLLGTSGRSVGGLLGSQRVVDQESGEPIGLARSAARCLVLALTCAVPVVGPLLVVLSSAWDPSGRHRGWHDRATRTVVLDLAVGIDPRTAGPTRTQAGGLVDGLLHPDNERRSLRPARQAANPPEPGDATASAAVGRGLLDEVALADAEGAIEDPGGRPATVAAAEAANDAADAADRPAADYDPWPTGDMPARAYPGAQQARARARGTDGREEAGMAPTKGRVVPHAPYERVSSPPYRALEDEVEQTQLREARSKVAYAPTRAQSRPRATLLLWDNRVVVLDGTALVGRNPSPREGESLPVQVIAVLDRGRSVSKTHFAMGVDADGVWLKDRSSTNGTIVTLTDGQQILCAPEQSVRVPVGASVAFGDYWLTIAG